jgi:ABC-type transporter lipoprotein component MlaA
VLRLLCIKQQNQGVTYMTQSILIAKYVVTRRYNNNKPISNIDLQKVLKLIQDETNLFSDSYEQLNRIYCYPNVYYHFAGFGVMPITNKYNIGISKYVTDKIDDIIDNFVDTPTRILQGGNLSN